MSPPTTPSSLPPGVFGEAGALARALIAYAPGRTVLALLLLLAAGVTEAFGLLMIIPLLHVVGLATQPGEQSLITEAVTRAADVIGVELTLPAVLAVFLALAVVRSSTAWQRDVLLAGIRLGFVDQFRGKLYAAIAGAKWEFLLGCRRSDHQHVLTSDVNRIGLGAFLILQLTVTAVLALAQIALALAVAPLVTATALVVGAVLLYLTRPLVRRSRNLGEELTGANRALYGSVTDFLAGLKLAKGYSAEEPHIRRFTETVALMRRRELAFIRVNSATRAGLNVGIAAALAALVWFAVSTAALPLPELLILALIFVRVLPGLVRLQQDAQQLAYALPAYTHAWAVYQALREAAETPANCGEPRMELREALTVRNLSFVYEAGTGAESNTEDESGTVPESGAESNTEAEFRARAESDTKAEFGTDTEFDSGTRTESEPVHGARAGIETESGAGNGLKAATGDGDESGVEVSAAAPALQDVSLDIPARKMTVITGPSGAGKSTLADLLLGLVEPAGGEVRVDGTPLTGPNLRRWRRSVACVLQDTYLFHDTIRANLRWARPDAGEAQMWQALRLAAASEFVAALPEGLDTITGDRGGRLSGGERQRIALARALMREPSLLLLDEATSQLDAENEQQILTALKSLRGRVTIVAIAHRLALLEAADGIIMIESGRVAATGTWPDLATKIAALENTRAVADPAPP